MIFDNRIEDQAGSISRIVPFLTGFPMRIISGSATLAFGARIRLGEDFETASTYYSVFGKRKMFFLFDIYLYSMKYNRSDKMNR